MMEPAVDYSAAGIPVREDLRRTHLAMLEYFRKPGCWFTGAERRAIVAESRNAHACRLCIERKASLSPEHPKGRHARVSDLAEALVEIVHRLRLDPQRLSREWFERVTAAGLDEGAYVELIGIGAFSAGVDYFCRALGIEPFALPSPLPGEPSRYRPPNARAGTAWVSMIAPEDAAGAEANLYPAGGFVPNIARALSLVPDHVRMLQLESASHYVPMSDIPNPMVRRSLDRLQIELVAARVSAMNECFY
jgi:hypothetical protein